MGLAWDWGLFLGLIALVFPDALGLGFSVIKEAEHWVNPSLQFVILFILFKFLATYFSVGFGFSGGVITPVFIIGVFLGILYTVLISQWHPMTLADYRLFALAASAIFTSAVIGAPLTLTILSFEMTLNITFALNTFIGIVIAHLILKFLKVDSFYRTQYQVLYND